MAETAVAALIKVIFQKLADEALKKYARSQNIHSELNQLGISLSHVQAMLNDASNKEITNESVRLWLNNLQHVAYDIDDVLDDVSTEAMHRELTVHEPGSSTSMVRKLIPTCCTKFTLSHRLSPKLDDINTRLEQLTKQTSDLSLIIKLDEEPKSISRRDETSLLESDVVGRKGETEKLINKLLQDEPSKENFIIVPIVGMGGVGKTTLARILYNDPRVKGHFELMAWVCVSDVFNAFKISESIFQSVAKKEEKNEQFKDTNQLQIALQEQFKDKLFLLVLDDVWTENFDDWENLMRPFRSGATGSRVIMTTRKEHLLKKIGLHNLDHLECLAHEDALSLLAIHALGEENFDSHATLKPQAKGIVKNCGSLPLALKAMGRLLRTKKEEEWDDVLNSEIWNLENADEIVPALRLTYHNLSADLKRLFAYCSLFPKGFLFDKEELVLLWMAEGYLKESNANKSPESLGHEYFEKLLSRSFFQHAPNGEPFFVMHDLMNDLATFVAGEYFFRSDNQMEIAEEALAKYRHMSFIREEYVAFQKFEGFERARRLRTLLAVYVGIDQGWNRFYLSNKILVDLLPKLPLLRVLSLSHFNINEVPDFIGTLKHLRYLNLSGTDIKELPENVGNLYNLQILIVSGCKELTKIPESFFKLKRLRHFDIRDTPLLKKLPLIGELKSLQTLTLPLTRIISGGNVESISDLQLSNLTWLDIEGCESIESFPNLLLPNLKHLFLRSCKNMKEIRDLMVYNLISWSIIDCENLESISNLHLSKLTWLDIEGCESIESFPNLQLPNLKHLSLRSCKNMKEIRDLMAYNLISWSIIDCENLESIPKIEQCILPMLRDLIIIRCPMFDLPGILLPNLLSLRIGQLKKPMLERGCRYLPASLVHLRLDGEAEVRNISELSHLLPSTLTSLNIYAFKNLESFSMGLQHLTSLQHLTIWKCPKLIDLPETLLPSLVSLRITGDCPKLKKRCNRRGSHYWPLISHIPEINIY